MRDYYDARAGEYDEWWLGTGLFADRERRGWAGEVLELQAALDALAPLRTIDIACGTGFLTRHLPGEVVGIDQSERMLTIARGRVPGARFIHADAFAVPFSDDAFERLFTGHFYGHLDPAERAEFLREARRLARELVVVDSALRPGVDPESVQERVLNDGSRWEVLKRFFTADALIEELGGEGRALFAGAWFVAVQCPLA